jgi:putative transposase
MSAPFIPFSALPTPNKNRRDLPHWEVPGASYFLTFRLADSLPTGVLAEMEHSAKAWLNLHGLNERREVQWLPPEIREEFRRVISIEEERWLDAGHGACILRKPELRGFLIETLHFHDGARYALDEYVIMPNHAHVLLVPTSEWSLREILATWKKFAARRINEALRKSGTLWRQETFDHIVRTEEKLESCRRYIRANPTKARLKAGDFHLGCGSGIVANGRGTANNVP